MATSGSATDVRTEEARHPASSTQGGRFLSGNLLSEGEGSHPKGHPSGRDPGISRVRIYGITVWHVAS